jgi:hypothetical protein
MKDVGKIFDCKNGTPSLIGKKFQFRPQFTFPKINKTKHRKDVDCFRVYMTGLWVCVFDFFYY